MIAVFDQAALAFRSHAAALKQKAPVPSRIACVPWDERFIKTPVVPPILGRLFGKQKPAGESDRFKGPASLCEYDIFDANPALPMMIPSALITVAAPA